MEGHETSDWNSYYADTQEVSKSQGLASLLPLCRGGEDLGVAGGLEGAAIGGIGLQSRSCQRKRTSPSLRRRNWPGFPKENTASRSPGGVWGRRGAAASPPGGPGGRGQPLISSKRRNLLSRRSQKHPVNSWLGAEDSPRRRHPTPSRQMAGAEGEGRQRVLVGGSAFPELLGGTSPLSTRHRRALTC